MENNKIFLGKYRAVDPFDESIDRSQVLEAEDIVSGKKAIVEVIPAVGVKASVLEQVQSEAAAAMKLAHANIPALYDFGVEDDRLVYVTEYFEGTTAEEWVKEHGPMPTGAVLRIALQVMSALGAASFHRISHHAINPSNLLLVPGQTPEGDWPLVKVLHFVGLPPQFGSTDVDVEVAAFDKSSHYASPEQLQHGRVDFRSEVFSLGCTMWFLLTGAPPLMAPNGPVSVQPTTTGLAVDKLSGMPKGVRRLLGKMLSANPEARPQDPLAFYRQIQGCLEQMERRATMARRFGLPSMARTHSIGAPRRVSMKALALAAVLLACAVLTALVVPEYLRHKRVVEAQEPIGVPIGVPDASPVAVVASTPNAPAPSETQPANQPALASLSNQPAAPNAAGENAPVAANTDSATVASANQPVPPQAETAIAAPDTQVEQAPAPTGNTNTGPAIASAPAADESRAPAAQAPATTKPTEVASAEQTSTAPPKVVQRKVQPDARAKQEKIVSARPVSPEVRRAEPAPPAEGPDETDDDEDASQPANSTAKTTTSRNVEDEAGASVIEQPPSTLRARTAAPSIASTAKEKRKSRKEPNRRVLAAEPADVDEFEDAPAVRSGSVRAKFIGMTPDGRMMLALPSREVVIVPAPPGYR